MGIPPINGTCPDGFALSPDGSTCLPITVPLRVDVAGVAAQEIDPTQAARLADRGHARSGLIERAVVAWFFAAWNLFTSLVSLAFGKWDEFLAALGSLFLSAQGQG